LAVGKYFESIISCFWVRHCDGCNKFEFNDKYITVYEKWFCKTEETGGSAYTSEDNLCYAIVSAICCFVEIVITNITN